MTAKAPVVALLVGLCAVACGRSPTPPAGEDVTQSPAGSNAESSPAAAELIAAERGFARASVESGVQAAFLEYLAPEAVVFRPGPVDGPAWFRDRPPPAGQLDWEPEFVGLSRDGNMGYSTGPYVYRGAGDASPAFGRFVSVWRRDPDGPWRVVIDAGTPHPQPGPEVSRVGVAPVAPQHSGVVYEATAPSVAERRRAEMLGASGAATTARGIAAEHVRWLRAGQQPWIGNVVPADWNDDPLETARRELIAADTAGSGDLAYTYGRWVAHGADGVSGHYLSIWSRSPTGVWQLVLDAAF